MTPVLSVITGNNGKLLAEVARLWIDADDEVLDLTYGRGNFWTAYRPPKLLTSDLYAPADMALDYRRLPAQMVDWCDVVVFDPPYITTGDRATSTLRGRSGDTRGGDFHRAYGLEHTPRGARHLQAVNDLGIEGSARALRNRGRLLVKTMDYVESASMQWSRQHTVNTALRCGLEQVDEFVLHSGTGPQPQLKRDGTPRRQIHSRRAHSFLCVFAKKNRRRYK